MGLIKAIKRFLNPPARLKLICVSYYEADNYLNDGWSIAKEEDSNQNIGIVYLELLEDVQ